VKYLCDIQKSWRQDAKMPSYQNIDLVISHAGGYGKCTFTRGDALNYIIPVRRKKLKHMKGSDTSILMDYLAKKKLRDPYFFYTYSFKREGLKWNIGGGWTWESCIPALS
jgi:hypothetical protein